MRDYDIREVHDLGNDVLRVRGTNRLQEVYGDEGAVIDHVEVIDEAYGWVSATENHYDPDAYYAEGEQAAWDPENPDELVDVGGHLKPDAKPRPMTKAERLAYYQRLLEEQNPATTTPREIPL